jgi:hypothetical protein
MQHCACGNGQKTILKKKNAVPREAVLLSAALVRRRRIFKQQLSIFVY